MITPIQYKIYQFIQEFIQENGYAPALKEIALAVGIDPKSKSFISACVHALANKGMLNMGAKYKSRNIALVNASPLNLPLLGRIAAGLPIEAIQEPEYLDVGTLFAGENHYVLEVKGDSMIEEGIWDSDMVICKRQETAKDGDIVIALIDSHAATLKCIRYLPAGEIMLLPANSSLAPQVYPAERVQIQGIFVGLLRLQNKPSYKYY